MKILEKLKQFVHDVFPYNTKRGLFIRMLYRLVRSPLGIAKKLTRQRIKKFFYSLFKDDRGTFKEKLKRFFDIYDTKVKLFYPPEPNKELKVLEFPKVEQPLVSIVIPVYNQWLHTYCCLLSILEHTPDIRYEVIVADDVSTDETVNILSYTRNVTVVRNQNNLGFLLNCNNAASKARGKYILFLNNDTNVQENWLNHLVNLIESDEKIGMVGSKLVYPNGRLQEAGGIIWKDASGWNYGNMDHPAKPEYNYVKEVDYISGASIMIRSDLWNQIGGFDERFAPAYYEDADLAFEVRKYGYKVMYQPKSVVVHFEGRSHGTDINAGIKSYQVKNREKFIEKWKDNLLNEQFENGNNVFWARDRSKGKKTILIIDHYVPTRDKDAGSRTMFQYLKLFTNLGMNVKFYGDNPHPYQPYTDELLQLGIEVLYGDFSFKVFEKWIIENGKYIDYTYLLRPYISEKYIDLIKNFTDSKIAYNGTDFHWIREERQYKIDNNSETLKHAQEMKKIEFNLFNKSDIVITISEFEKSLLEQEMPGKNVVVIPTFIYESDFPLGKSNSVNERKFVTFVGGFSHIPNVDGILWFTQSIWPKIQSEYPELELKIIGSNPPEQIKNLSSDTVEVTGYLSDQMLEEYYSKTRVVVAPLRYGAGVKGKIIEAIAHGIPTVTTSIGAEGITDSEHLLAVQDDEDLFAQSVLQLIRDNELWSRTRQACIDYSKDNFSIKSAEQILTQNIFN